MAGTRTPAPRDNGEDSWTGWRRPSTGSRRMPTMPAGVPNEARTESFFMQDEVALIEPVLAGRRLATEARCPFLWRRDRVDHGACESLERSQPGSL